MPIGSTSRDAVVGYTVADKQGRDRNRPRTFCRYRLSSSQGSAIVGRGSKQAAATLRAQPITLASQGRYSIVKDQGVYFVKLLINNNLTTTNIRKYRPKVHINRRKYTLLSPLKTVI